MSREDVGECLTECEPLKLDVCSCNDTEGSLADSQQVQDSRNKRFSIVVEEELLR